MKQANNEFASTFLGTDVPEKITFLAGDGCGTESRSVDYERRERLIWSSEEESMVDALEPSGDEGRGKLRKASVRSTHPTIRRLPNGVTRLV